MWACTNHVTSGGRASGQDVTCLATLVARCTAFKMSCGRLSSSKFDRLSCESTRSCSQSSLSLVLKTQPVA